MAEVDSLAYPKMVGTIKSFRDVCAEKVGEHVKFHTRVHHQREDTRSRRGLRAYGIRGRFDDEAALDQNFPTHRYRGGSVKCEKVDLGLKSIVHLTFFGEVRSVGTSVLGSLIIY